jgi:4'-phosphopantetheinyl transferase
MTGLTTLTGDQATTAVVHARWSTPTSSTLTRSTAASSTAPPSWGGPPFWLDDTERRRLAGLGHPELRASFATSRLLLRLLVAELADVQPSTIRFGYTCPHCGEAHGRPVVRAPEAAARFHVSLSHAGARVVVAATEEGPVGVDVERTAAVDFAGFDAVALTAVERDRIADLHPADRSLARAMTWVRKEALLKATGTGLMVDPGRVDLSEAPARFHDLQVGLGFVAAVAVLTDRPVRLSARDVTGEVSGELPAARAEPVRATTAAADD